MNIKARSNLVLIFVIVATVMVTAIGCVSVTAENVASGKVFRNPSWDHADPSVPSEEQSVIVNLCDEAGSQMSVIARINGKSARKGLGMNGSPNKSVITYEVIVLEPGEHNIEVFFHGLSYKISGYVADVTATVNVPATLEPGHYYALQGGSTGNDRVGYTIIDLEDVSHVYMDSGKSIPSSDVVNGMRIVVEKGRR